MDIFKSNSKIRARLIMANLIGEVPSQFWSTCGNCTIPGTELHQLLELGLIKPHQFHGVDHKREVYETNITINNGAHFYHGDFCDVIIEQDNAGNFHPSVVHFDSPEQMGGLQAREIAKVIGLLSCVSKPPEFIAINSLLRCRARSATIQVVLDELAKQPAWQHYGRLWAPVGCYPYKDNHSELAYLFFQKH